MVYIKWVDAICIGSSGWNDPSELDDWAYADPPIMHTMGYLIHSTDDYVVVVDSIGPNEVGCANKIPTAMVQEMYTLKAQIESNGLELS